MMPPAAGMGRSRNMRGGRVNWRAMWRVAGSALILFMSQGDGTNALAQQSGAPVLIVPGQQAAPARAPRRDWGKLRQRARAGDAAAMLSLARAYETGGQGLRKSLPRAASWYRRAAQAGETRAMTRLAALLLKGGEGVRRAPRVAASLLLEAARRGDVAAMHHFAWVMEKGIGLPADMKLAARWYDKAARQGHAPSQVALALMYLTGRGVERDLEKAREWLEKAAAQGDAWALNNLGVLHERGWGVAKNRSRAIELYRRAAEMDNPAARRNLRRLGLSDPLESSFFLAREAVSGRRDREPAREERQESPPESAARSVVEPGESEAHKPATREGNGSQKQHRRRYNYTAGRGR